MEVVFIVPQKLLGIKYLNSAFVIQGIWIIMGHALNALLIQYGINQVHLASV